MTRNLKVLLLAVMAVGALGALAASGAAAASFTVSGAAAGETTTTTTLKDGTGKTAHQVIEIRDKNKLNPIPLTCNEVTGTGHIIGESSTDGTVVTPVFEGGGAVFPQCSFNGTSVSVENTGCNFTFTASGELHIVSEPGAVAPNLCKHGEKPIHISMPNCKVEVGEQTVKGIVFHNLADGTLTVEANNVEGIQFNAVGTLCPYGTLATGIFTTGNTIVTGETTGGVMRTLTIITP